MPTDRDLWERIVKGDAASFDAFYRANAPGLQGFLRQIVGNPQAAEDVSQETFIQIWNRPNGFQPEHGALRTYLYGIGRKRAAEWWRRQSPAQQEKKSAASPDHSETASVVGDAFQRLPEEQRNLLWLREVEGQSYAELAAILEIPVGTVRSRLFAAREALRTIWRSPHKTLKEDV